MVVWEALQITEKRREANRKGEKERYTHLNAEFQRTAKRNKKAFLSDQCKETEENNRMGKTRDLFKKVRDSKGTFHAKMGTIKDRNGMDLTEEDIKKRWQEDTWELYKKDLCDPDNHDGVITHLEPDILECKVKWALGEWSEFTQSCPTLCGPMDYAVHRIFPARILEWVAFPLDLPNPGIKPRSPALQADSLPGEPQGKSIGLRKYHYKQS